MNTLNWILKKEGVKIKEEDLLYIRDFTLVWNIFENKLGCPSNYDILINNLKKLEEKNTDICDCDGLIEYFIDRYISGPNKDYNSNGLKLKNKDEVLAKLRIDNSYVISESLLPIILRVRNNLFHGNKSIHSMEVQQELFDRIVEFLKRLIDSIDGNN